MNRWQAWEDDVLTAHYGVRTFCQVRRMLPDRTAREIKHRALKKVPMKKLDPSTAHRRCCACLNVKPMADFKRAEGKPLGRSYYCMPCHRARDAAYQRERRKIQAKPAPKQRVEPLYPMPRMDLCEQLACVQLRKWRGPVNEGPLVPALGWVVLPRAA